jgi:hypothetical protein
LRLGALRSASLWAAVAGLGLGLLALGPGLRRGFLLSYDMVFVPAPPFNAEMFGLSGTLPRSVPSDAVVAAAARVLPADIVQKLVLLAIFVLACAGVAVLLARAAEPGVACLAGGVFYAWNPFVAERLILGQWALLLGYAGLPWVAVAVTGPAVSQWRRAGRLLVALLPAAVGGFAAMCVSGLLVVPGAACAAAKPGDGLPPAMTPPARTLPRRLLSVATALAVMALLSLDWVIPSLTQAVHTGSAGVAAFAARADTPFGSLGSLLMLGGTWNAQTVPRGYGGPASVLWLAVVVASIGAFAALGARRWPGLAIAAVAGLAVASIGVTGPGQDLLRSLIAAWPGFAVLRDGQQYVAPLALAEAAGFGLGVGWVMRRAGRLHRPSWAKDTRPVIATIALVIPVVLLPGLGWGAQGRLRPVQYPSDWLEARRLIDADPAPGSVLLLPWAAYRRFSWNGGEALLDPWPKMLARRVIWNDGVQVGNMAIPPEDPAALALNAVIESGRSLTRPLRAAGVRYVVVDAGFGPGATRGPGGYPYESRLPGCRAVVTGPDLVVYRLPRLPKGARTSG